MKFSETKHAKIEETSFAKKKGINFFQPKLTINQPNDVYEQEADAMADKVMRMEQPFIQAKPIPVTPVQRKCAECEENEKKIQRRTLFGTAELEKQDNITNKVEQLPSGGEQLPDDLRNFYEPRFGYDFSNVKIHTDAEATHSAQSVNAMAYTSGNNIVFNSGQYAPGSLEGKNLIAHELTHVIQQAGAGNTNQIMRRTLRDTRINFLCGGKDPFLRTPPFGFFTLNAGESQITATFDIAWDRPNCGSGDLFVALKRRRSIMWDENMGDRTIHIGGGSTPVTWTGLTTGEDYYIEIRHISTNPNCCVTGPLVVEAL